MDAPSRPVPHVASVEDLHTLSTFTHQIGVTADGAPVVLLLRRLDLFAKFIENIVPLDLFKAAVAALESIKDEIVKGEAEAREAFGRLPDEDRQALLEALHRNAIAMVLQPKLSPDGAPGTFPVTMLDPGILITLWNINPPQAVLPRLVGDAATTFRASEPGPAATPAHAGEDVRGEAEQLAPTAVAVDHA